ncbi:trypsin-like serine peptidase [Nocardioides stalactiti]|uniref:trypsin-like serine peptidase n=1 Tax=Nocardioides stalactiti TaxID=2755356 RepID=UPI00160175EA|nr:hypothetical protein [Nocardioides stalactiti]
MGSLRSFVGLAVGALVVGTLSSVSPATAADDASEAAARPTAPARVVAGARSQRTPAEIRAYWTPERMAAAVPIEELLPDLLGGVLGSATGDRDRAGDRAGATDARGEVVRAPRSTGKLFFNVDGADAVCTASAIDTPKGNQVITAGHCVHTGPNPGGLLPPPPHFYSDWVFVPRYRNGAAPFGRWVSDKPFVFAGWAEEEAFKFDQAIITFRRLERRRLVDVVGGNEVVWGNDQRQWGTRIWGWPAESPYDGETSKRCDGRTVRFEESADAAMYDCDLTGGASGGPWYLPRGRTDNTGRIWAITSRRVINDPILLARPIPSEIRRMIRTANN